MLLLCLEDDFVVPMWRNFSFSACSIVAAITCSEESAKTCDVPKLFFTLGLKTIYYYNKFSRHLKIHHQLER